MGEGLTLTLPSEINLELNKNFSLFISSNFDDEVTAEADPNYEQFLADVWIGIVLTLMVLSCVCFMCSCLLYHKFQQWKRSAVETRNPSNIESVQIEVDLPSYTIASGLPSYQEALEQLKKVEVLTKDSSKTSDTNYNDWISHSASATLNPLSVVNLFQLYKNSAESSLAMKHV